MDDKFNLEEIMKEFGEEPAEQPREAEEIVEEPGDTKRMEFDRSDLPELDMEETRRIDNVETEAPRFDMLDETRRIDPEEIAESVSGDTIRMKGLRVELSKMEDQPEELDTQETDEAFSEEWEPDYEQPMGEYIPPQPIAFRPRSRLHELKQKLIAGPEKRFYELSEKGVGRLQAAIFLSALVVLIAAVSTATVRVNHIYGV